MFLNKDYILANELVQQMGIHIANVSIMRKQFEDADDYHTIIKMKNCSFINSVSQKLPKNIQKGISKYNFTDFSNKLPCSYISQEYEVNEKELTQSGLITGKLMICGKYFYEFDKDFVKTVHGKITYVLNEEEAHKCKRNKEIDGYIKLSKNKFFTWY